MKNQLQKSYGYIPKLLLIAVVVAAVAYDLGTIKYSNAIASTDTGIASVQTVQRYIPPKPKYTFPEGGLTIFPHYRLVALYGFPNAPVLGALGQQPLPATVTRTLALAKTYQPYSTQSILPTLEIITTLASATPTANNDYSAESDPSTLQPWVTAARQNGMYVVLDLQSGRDTFLSQAKEYVSLLEQPNVGLALDPEWSLGPTQVPLVQIGSVNISDVNQTASWLASLTEDNKLPQKLFMLQQFRLSMLPNRNQLNTTLPQLAYVIQMDGQGTQDEKISTWNTILQGAPPNVHFGWKNFYTKDSPLRSPADTMSLTPEPWYISYE